MKKSRILIGALSACLIASGSMFLGGCSTDSPTGPGGGNTPMDELTLSFSRISATYDCDNNISLTDDAAGDFNYTFSVSVLNDQGSWETVKSFASQETKVNSGSSASITNRAVTFTVPRVDAQRFRVSWSIWEADAFGGSDFGTRSNTITHEYRNGQSKLWAPVDRDYSSFSATTNSGTVSKGEHVRGQSTVLGIVTEEGCSFSITYDVRVTPLN